MLGDRIKLVDATLNNMRNAGFELDKDAVAFVWKAARGETCDAEVEAWTATMAANLKGRPNLQELHSRLTALANNIAAELDQIAQRTKKLLNSEPDPSSRRGLAGDVD